MLFKELMTDGLSLENKRRYKILHMVDAPSKPLVTPIPDAGAVFEYRFVNEVHNFSFNFPLILFRSKIERLLGYLFCLVLFIMYIYPLRF